MKAQELLVTHTTGVSLEAQKGRLEECISEVRGGEGGGGEGREAPKDYTKPRQLIQSPDRQYKAPKHYTKPQKDSTKPEKDYAKTYNITQRPKVLDKEPQY